MQPWSTALQNSPPRPLFPATGQTIAPGTRASADELTQAFFAPMPYAPYIVTGTASTVKAFEQTLQQIEQLYLVTNSSAVRQFIRLHPALANVLLEAYGLLSELFGPSPKVSLSVVHDPEQENLTELIASILTPLEPDAALGRLDALDEYWFLDQLDRVQGHLNFNLEFV